MTIASWATARRARGIGWGDSNSGPPPEGSPGRSSVSDLTCGSLEPVVTAGARCAPRPADSACTAGSGPVESRPPPALRSSATRDRSVGRVRQGRGQPPLSTTAAARRLWLMGRRSWSGLHLVWLLIIGRGDLVTTVAVTSIKRGYGPGSLNFCNVDSYRRLISRHSRHYRS